MCRHMSTEQPLVCLHIISGSEFPSALYENEVLKEKVDFSNDPEMMMLKL